MRPRGLDAKPEGRRALAGLIALSCVLLPGFAPAQGDAASGDRALKAAVAKLVQDTGIRSSEPGIAVLAVTPGRILLMEGYGLANIASKEVITPCTRFDLASVSKTFTSTAVLILQERGLLSIDDDVRKYLPELPQYPNGPLRVRDLLHHISGLTDYLELDSISKSNKLYWVNTDYLAALAKAKLDFPIGQKYEYNNTNYMLLALVVERVAKKPFGEVLRDEIFLPAGMKNTFVYSSPASIPENATPPCNNAVGYENEKKRWVARWGFPRPSAGRTPGSGGRGDLEQSGRHGQLGYGPALEQAAHAGNHQAGAHRLPEKRWLRPGLAALPRRQGPDPWLRP